MKLTITITVSYFETYHPRAKSACRRTHTSRASESRRNAAGASCERFGDSEGDSPAVDEADPGSPGVSASARSHARCPSRGGASPGSRRRVQCNCTFSGEVRRTR